MSRGCPSTTVTGSGPVRAVDRVDLDLAAGEFLGIVGESGSGKSTLLFAIAQLLTPPAQVADGTVQFLGRDLVQLTRAELRHSRWRDFSVVMQSAMNALNPVMSLEAQMRDVCEAHSEMSSKEIQTRSVEVMRLVGIDPVHLRSYPHQLSGWDAPASDDRDGAALPASARDHGRADFIARRSRPALADDPGEAAAAAASVSP